MHLQTCKGKAEGTKWSRLKSPDPEAVRVVACAVFAMHAGPAACRLTRGKIAASTGLDFYGVVRFRQNTAASRGTSLSFG